MAYLKQNYLMIVLVFAATIGFSLWLNERISPSTEAFSVQKQPVTVILDAGHGGEDGGAVSCTGVHESRINLEITNRLADLFPLLGVRVRSLRTEDISLYDPSCETVSAKKVSDLKNRVRMVNETPNGLLVSIHQNEFPEAKYSGAQVFYAPGCEELAKDVQEALRLGLNPSNDRRCKPAENIYLMNHITCPGILIECGFLSNREEEAELRQPDYQKRLAICIAASVSRYLQKETNDEV